MEQPEDLGALPTGPHEGLRPASMWQWPQLADLLKKGLRSVAFHQASFGQRQAKGAFKTAGSEQWPVAMCQWLSAMLLSSCLLPAKDAVGGGGRYARR